jgi:nucleoporin POM152
MSPISTAHLNPQNLNFCLASSGSVLIPVILNNTNIAGLKYSLTPLGYPERNSRIEVHELSGKDFRYIQETYREKLQFAVHATKQAKDDEFDEYDDDDDRQTQEARHNLQKTQSLVHILINRPGVVRLERVYDSSTVDARLVASQAIVVPCPRVQFAKDEESAQDAIRCIGQKADPQLKITVHGVPPLSLKWMRSINGKREQFLVEGIEKDHKDHALRQDDQSTDAGVNTVTSAVSFPHDVTVPLTVSLDKPGTYLYALEEVTDGVGNTVRVETDPISLESVSASAMTTTRSFIVLQKPTIAFAYCSSDMPTSLLIGSEVKLNLDPTHLDNFDKPWDIHIQYQPPNDDQSGRQLKAWKKTLKYDGERRDLSLNANAPGDYKIVGFKGKVSTC